MPPLSERKLRHYINSKKLLSLPDEILEAIASYLVPLPPSNPPTISTLVHAFSLSQTCKRLHRIVISRLSVLDFVTPTSYTALGCRTPSHVSRHIEAFVTAAAPHLRDLRLPQGYVPRDGSYTPIATCGQLTHLAMPAGPELNVAQAQMFFASFEKLTSVTLDLASRAFVVGLCYAPECLREVTLTKFPAEATWFTALSTLLIGKGRHLTKLCVNFLCEDSKDVYEAELGDSWMHGKWLMQSERALTRMSSLLERHFNCGEIPNLRELDISTIPDASMDMCYFVSNYTSGLPSKVLLFRRAIQRAREENPQPRGLKKLRMGVASDCSHVTVALMSKWLDPEVDVEISFADCKILFPRNIPYEQPAEPIVTQLTLRFQPYMTRLILPDAKIELETLCIASDYSILPTDPLSWLITSFANVTKGGRLSTLQITYGFPKLSALKNLAVFLGRVASLMPSLTTLELPADAAIFSASAEAITSLTDKKKYSIKVLRLYNFRKDKILMLGMATAAWQYPVEHIPINDIKQKAKWFLKGLPSFLRMLKKDFPKLEVLYMEQTCFKRSVVNEDLFEAMHAIDWYERTARVDASTLRTEIMEWRRKAAPTSLQ